jgi:hypothetical protein
MELDSTEVIKSYLLQAPCMAFVSMHAVLKELQNNECCIVDVKGLQIERNFYFARLQEDAGGAIHQVCFISAAEMSS